MSATVRSDVCPSAVTTGSRDARIARAITSLLKANISSKLPPPRAMIKTSASASELQRRSAREMLPGAALPWTCTGYTTTPMLG